MSAPTPTPAEPQRPAEPKNGFGTTGFVLGLIGLIFAFIPIIGVIGWPLVILGIIFSLIGMLRVRSGKANNQGMSIAGLIVSIIGLVICILWTVAFGNAANEVTKENNKVSTIRYEVTGTAKGANVTYSTFSGSNSNSSQEDLKSLPWHKEVQAKGLGKSGSMTVTTGPGGGKVACKVLIDGKTAKTSTASGQFATASCDNFGG